LKLIACSICHAQYDVSDVSASSFPCRCGETLENRSYGAVDATIHRCGSCGAIVAADAESCSYCSSAIVRDPGKLSLICPECYARCAEDARFCTACGVAFRPEPIHLDGFELPCPVCDLLMPPHQIGGVGINECTRCNGVWVGGDDLDRLISRAIDSRRSADPTGLQALAPRVTGANPAAQRIEYRKCPVCMGFMQRRNFRKSSGVIIDCCRSHGSWLDADELEQIAGFILSGGKPSATLLEPEPSRGERRATAESARIRAAHSSSSRRNREENGFVGTLLDVLTELLR
jgi:Zn-finger nucleic acid-binding protein